jgi:hypothetical protein
MERGKFSIRQAIVAASLLLASSLAAFAQAEPQRFDSGREWGWGGTPSLPKAEAAPVTKTVQISYFDQEIGERLLGKDFRHLTDGVFVRESFVRSVNVYRNPFGRFSYFGYVHQDFYDSVYAYLASNAWEEDLKKLPEGDAAFVRTIVYFCFTEIQDRRYIQVQLDKITDSEQRELLHDLFRVKPTHDVLHANHWEMFIGLGPNFFTNGAGDKLSPGPAFDLGFGFCLFGRYCTDFRIGSIVITDPYKEDIVQEGITYPKEYISYTAVEALLRAKIVYSYDYEISVFGGLRLHAIEFDSEEGKIYKQEYGRDMENEDIFGLTAGISGAKYFIGNGVIPKVLGIGARVGIANFGDNGIDLVGFNWYGGIDLIMRFGKY